MIMKDEKIIKLFNEHAAYYPYKLEQQFPQIFSKIMMMWDSIEFDSYLNKFMLDKREHARQGFPPEVASEILRLSMLHSQLFGTEPTNSWVDGSTIKVE
jgi:uncharacterized protein